MVPQSLQFGTCNSAISHLMSHPRGVITESPTCAHLIQPPKQVLPAHQKDGQRGSLMHRQVLTEKLSSFKQQQRLYTD